jgi:hypothetical protein
MRGGEYCVLRGIFVLYVSRSIIRMLSAAFTCVGDIISAYVSKKEYTEV